MYFFKDVQIYTKNDYKSFESLSIFKVFSLITQKADAKPDDRETRHVLERETTETDQGSNL